MKTLITKIFIVLIMLGNFSQAQNWIQNYDGIPVHTGLWWGWTNEGRYPGAIDSMKKIVDIISTDIGVLEREAIDPLNQINYLKLKGLKLIPVRSRTREASQLYNWIQHYTDAKYSIWEAEGTAPGYGDATLEYNSSVMTEYTDGDTTYLKLNLNASGLSDTNLIWGPYYVQDAVYYASQDSLTPLIYTANFRLKLDYINGIPNGNDNPNDSVCLIQVTYSTPQGTQGLACTYIVKQDTIIRSRLKNYFTNFSLDYMLTTNGCDGSSTNEIPQQNTFHSSTRRDTLLPGPRNAKEYVEFRVVWLGKPQYLLSIDNVTVSDQRGRELFVDPFKDTYRQRIIDQSNTSDSLNADTVIVGWLGIDEPVSIDVFKPIQLVAQLLDDNSQNKHPLWLALMGKYDGAFRDRGDIHGAMRLSPWTEMKKRIGNINIWQDFYLYDYPCNENSIESICQGDWRSANIWRMAELNYKQAYQLNPNFGVSLQCGEIHNTQAYERNIGSHELLYNTNLALMYGAKFISLYSYFAQRDTDSCDSGWLCHAIVDMDPDDGHLIYTPKYNMLKNILKPRLNGLLGKTLKKLTPTEQYLNHALSSSEGFIQSITKGGCTIQGMQPSDEAYDLGFFKDDLDRDYFMLISRWYNPGCNPALTINIKPEYFPDNYNLKVVNLINNTTLNTITKYGNIYTAPEVGDACFFSIVPIVKYGGLLAYNDTIKTNTTLSDNLTIDAGKVLQINEGKTYTITDTISFIDTSSFITGYGYINRTQNGWITTRIWNKSLFKGRSGSHPKLIWSKHPDITNVIEYKIYRDYASGGWQYLTSKSNSTFEFIDSSVTIIEGLPNANEVWAQYRVTATYRPYKPVIETRPSNIIMYQRVEGQGFEKQNSGLTPGNDFTYNLDQNYPNPFNPTTTIRYQIPQSGVVTLKIYDILGSEVATLVNEDKVAGKYEVNFNANTLSSGVYIYKIQTGSFMNSKKLILLK